MSAAIGPVSTSGTSPATVCLTGFIRRRPAVSIFQRGTHLLVDLNGRVIAVLHSNQVNLINFEGRFVTVCGINEGQIEGVTSLLVTQVLAANIPGSVQPPSQINTQLLLLLLLLSQPRSITPGLLQILLLSSLFGTGQQVGV